MAVVSTNSSEVIHLNEEMQAIRLALKDPKQIDLEKVFVISDHLTSICLEGEEIAKNSKNPLLCAHARELIFEGQKLFSVIESLEQNQIQQDFKTLEEIQKIIIQAQILDFEFVLLSPDEIAKGLIFLSNRLEEVSQKNFYHQKLFEQLLNEALEKINHLRFRLDFPITEELYELSFQNTFAHRLLTLAHRLEQKEESSLSSLSDKQQKKVYSYIASIKNCKEEEDGKKFFERSTPREKAFLVIGYLRFLQQLAMIAQEYFYGEFERATKFLHKLKRDIQHKIEQYLWRFGPLSFNDIDQEQAFVLTRALMCFIADAILE